MKKTKMLKRKKKNKQNKKAQEEMMGFVLIVLVVIIIGVIFFAFSLRRPTAGILEHKSGEMADLLHAMLTCKTNCSVNIIDQPLDEVIRLCLNDPEKCKDKENKRRSACEIANDTFSQMLNEFLGEKTSIKERVIHGYRLSLSVGKAPFIGKIGPLEAGELTGSLFSVFEFIPNPLGRTQDPIEVRLRCYHVKAEAETEE